jgi:hypothetical protein
MSDDDDNGQAAHEADMLKREQDETPEQKTLWGWEFAKEANTEETQ